MPLWAVCNGRLMPTLEHAISELLEQSIPPDEDMVDLIQRAFLQGQIDGLSADLAHILIPRRVSQGTHRSKLTDMH